MNRFRKVMRAGGRVWQDAYHVERNPAGSGTHIHAWHWGHAVEVAEVSEAAIRAGMGSFADLQPRSSPGGQALTYGMKTVLQGDNRRSDLPPATEDYLNINGSRLGHATPGFWRDAEGNRLAGVRAATRQVAPSKAGDWILVREPSPSD